MKVKSQGATAPSKFISTVFNNKLPEGLKVTEYPWENEYRGTDAAFIESGLIKPEWLPGKPGNPKGKVRVALVNREMRALPAGAVPTEEQWDKGFISLRRSSKGRLIVSIYCLKKEREKREEAESLERDKKRAEEAHQEIDKDIAELPTNPDAFIGKQLHTFRSLMSVLRTNLTEGFGYSGGYSFPCDLVTEFDIAVDRSIQTIKDAHIHFDQEKRQKEVAKIKDRVLAKYRLSPNAESSES